MPTKKQPLPKTLGRQTKRVAGRTQASSTPLNLRTSGVAVGERLDAYVRERAGRKLAKFAYHAERVTVRFKEFNGPRGGVGTQCQIKVVVSGAPSVVTEEQAVRPRQAFDLAIATAERAMRRAVQSRGWSAGKPKAGKKPAEAKRVPKTPAYASPSGGSVIGRRVGRSAAQVALAAARPEKLRRDVPLDTSLPGRSASDRKAGGGSTAARNTKGKGTSAGAMLEDSAQNRPSRKSTRKSTGRAKRDSAQRIREVQRAHAPTSRAIRAKAQQAGRG